MNHRGASLLTVAAAAWAAAAFGWSRETLKSSLLPQTLTLTANTIYDVWGTTLRSGESSKSALIVPENSTVAICLREKCKLTVNGGDGVAGGADGKAQSDTISGNVSPSTVGGAGIEVPVSSRLIIFGDGEIHATGGRASSGGKGGWGAVSWKGSSSSKAGQGGQGGYGGCGAGAGIGTTGALGAQGGTPQEVGKEIGHSKDHDETYADKPEGHNGSTCGNKPPPAGAVYLLGRVAVKATGGGNAILPGKGGGAGTDNDAGHTYQDTWYRYVIACAGGGGGGGGGGSAPFGIGPGGFGGGGGGSGSRGRYNRFWWGNASKYFDVGQGGEGGEGSVKGSSGTTRTKDSDWGVRTGTATPGKGGGSGTDPDDVLTSPGILYTAELVSYTDSGRLGNRNEKIPGTIQHTETYNLGDTDQLAFKFTFADDLCEPQTVLYGDWPASVIPPEKGGFIFRGFYTGANRQGRRIFKSDGSSEERYLFVTDTPLYGFFEDERMVEWTGVYVNGRDLAYESGAGWEWDSASGVVKIFAEHNQNVFVISGTNLTKRVGIEAFGDVDLVFQNLCLMDQNAPQYPLVTVKSGSVATLQLSGASQLRCRSTTYPPLQVYGALTLTNGNYSSGARSLTLANDQGAPGLGLGKGATFVQACGVLNASARSSAPAIACTAFGIANFRLDAGTLWVAGGSSAKDDFGGSVTGAKLNVTVNGGSLGSARETAGTQVVKDGAGKTLRRIRTGVPDSPGDAKAVTLSDMATGGAAFAYGTLDVFPHDGFVYVWRPNGATTFAVNGMRAWARDADGWTEALFGVSGLTLDGRNVCTARGAGWNWSPATSNLLFTGDNTITVAGSDTTGLVHPIVGRDTNLKFASVTLAGWGVRDGVFEVTNGTLRLALDGTSRLYGLDRFRGSALSVASGAALEVVSGSGVLRAEGGFRGAGIGGAYDGTGALTFSSGTIIASGGFEGAGLGGASGVSGGRVTVAAGCAVTATGGYGAAGVGGGAWAEGGSLSGSVKATGGRWAEAVGRGNVDCGRIAVAADAGVPKSHVEVAEATDAALRAAVASVSANGGGDITFAASLDGKTIRLARRLPLAAGAGRVRIQSLVRVTLRPAEAYQDASDGLGGGALMHLGAGELTLTGLSFEGFRTAGCGGAIRTEGPLTLEYCTFRDCRADAYGGAVYAETNAMLTATGCRFTGNASVSAAGGAVYGRDALTLSSCSFDANTAAHYGGAVASFAPFDVTVAENVSFLDNSAGQSAGGLDASGGVALMAACTLTGNRGGAVRGADACHCVSVLSCGNETYLPILAADLELGFHASDGRAYRCVFGRPDLRVRFTSCLGALTPDRVFLRTTADTRVVGGVEQIFRKLTHANKSAVRGGVVWHGDRWATLAGSDRLSGARTVLYGGEHAGNLRTETDQLGEARTDDALLVGAVLAAAERESLVVTTEADVVDPEDGLVSLREAIAYADSTDLSPRSDSFREITFSKALKTGEGAFALTVTNGTLTVGGGRAVALNGGADEVARSLAAGGATTAGLFAIASDGALSLENLTLFGSGSGVLATSAGALQVRNCRLDGQNAQRCAAEVSAGRAWFERCTFAGLRGSKTLALEMTGGTGHFADVTLCDNVAEGGANIISVGAKATFDMANVTATGNACTGGGCLLSGSADAGMCLLNCALAGNTCDGAARDLKVTTRTLGAYSTFGKASGTVTDYAGCLQDKTADQCFRRPAADRRHFGVRQTYLGQVKGGAIHRNGCVVYASSVWDCLAYCLNATGAGRVPLRGNVGYATERVRTDIIERPIVGGYVSRGSYATERDGEGFDGLFVVNTAADFEQHLTAHDYDGLLTLREAVDMAQEDAENRDANGDCTVRFADAYFDGRHAAFTRLFREAISVTTNFAKGCLRIEGRTDRGTGLDGSAHYRLMIVTASNRVELSNLFFTNGVGTVVQPVNAGGGAIWNAGEMIVSNCAFVGSCAGGGRDPGRFIGHAAGGAVYTAGGGNTVLLDCSFRANYAGYGGALFTAPGGRSVAVASTFTANRAYAGNYITQPYGGAVAASCVGGPSETLLVNCTLTGNSCDGIGGAAYVAGSVQTYALDILSSVLLGNTSSDGFDFGTDARAKICHTVYGARAPGVDGKWLDRNSAGGLSVADVFATSVSGDARVETVQVGGVPHALALVRKEFVDEMPGRGAFARGYGAWRNVAYAATATVRGTALCGSLPLALRYGKLWTRDEGGGDWAAPVVGATTLMGVSVDLVQADGSVYRFASVADAAEQARAGDVLMIVSDDAEVPAQLALPSGVCVTGDTDVQRERIVAAARRFASANEWYTSRETAAGVVLELNEKAAPVLDSESETELASDDTVRVRPSNVRPNLYYGLGHSALPAGPYVVEEDGWVRARADGTLPSALTAPKAGTCGYYRVIAKDRLD